VGEGTRTEVLANHRTFVVDEPKSLGGKDEAPNPLLYFLGALAGCETATSHMASKKMEPPFFLNKIKFMIEGSLDPRGFQGVSGVASHFQHITISATVFTEEGDDRIQQLKSQVERQCPLHSLVHAAKIPVTSEWKRAEVSSYLS